MGTQLLKSVGVWAPLLLCVGCTDPAGSGGTPWIPPSGDGEETDGGPDTGGSTGGTWGGTGDGTTTDDPSGGTSGGSTGGDAGTTGDGTGESTGAGDTDGPADDQVCYPGPDLDWSVCYPLVTLDPAPNGYGYPDAYQQNPNYRRPVAFIDLTAIDPTDALAPNFTLGELAQTHKGDYAIVQPHAVVQLQDLRDALGAIGVNSGYRSPGYNVGIGGATYSRHMYGDAFDLDPGAVSLTTLEGACSDSGGMLVEYETHVHCDWRFDPVSEAFFGAEDDWSPALVDPGFGATLEPTGMTWTAPAVGFDEGEPTRRWTARGTDDQVLATHVGQDFVPPPGTARVQVVVGRVLVLTSDG